MALFKTSCLITLENEGGHVNNPLDPGGETYMGISRKFHPDWVGWRDVDATQHADIVDVMRFYRNLFWDPLLLDQVQDQRAANQIFDHAVNAGQTRAILIAQEAAGMDARDGKMGPITAGLINTNKFFTRRMFKLRVRWYLQASEKQQNEDTFLAGWIARVVKCHKG